MLSMHIAVIPKALMSRLTKQESSKEQILETLSYLYGFISSDGFTGTIQYQARRHALMIASNLGSDRSKHS